MKAPFSLPVEVNEQLFMLRIGGQLCAYLMMGDVDNWDSTKRLEYLQYISLACNSYEDLLEACEAYEVHMEGHNRSDHPKANMFCTQCPRIRKKIQAALAKANGE